MNKKDLLFYDAYEEFYLMAEKSRAFQLFCAEAFGEDFSQDGFSDIRQVNMILPFIAGENAHILDIGCGNGKMLGYLQEKTGCHIHGFDFSENAIKAAAQKYTRRADFIAGVIGETEYAPESFDVITSMDTMYFAKDMSAFVNQIMSWLKKGGVFFTCYQEGDVMPKTEDAFTTVLAKVLQEKSIHFEYIDITMESYDLLRRKRKAAFKCESLFEEEGNHSWFEMLVEQTDYANMPFDEYKKELARYVYIIKNNFDNYV